MGAVGLKIHPYKWGRVVESPKLETECNSTVSGYIRVLRGRGGFCGVTDPPAMVVCGNGDMGVSRHGRRGVILPGYMQPHCPFLPSSPCS